MPRSVNHVASRAKRKRKHAYMSHILTKKTKKRKRNLGKTGLVDRVDEKRIKELLNI